MEEYGWGIAVQCEHAYYAETFSVINPGQASTCLLHCFLL